jgi:hypothetical protein
MKATIKQPYFDGLDPSKWQHWPRRKASKDPSVWYHLRGSSRILGVSSNMAGKSPIYSGKCHIYRWLWWFLPAVNLHVEEICQPPLRKPEGDCWGSSSHAKKNMHQSLTLPFSLIHFIVICDSHLVWLLAVPFSQCLLFAMKDRGMKWSLKCWLHSNTWVDG